MNKEIFEEALRYYKERYPTMNVNTKYLKKYSDELIACYEMQRESISDFNDWTQVKELLGPSQVRFKEAEKAIAEYRRVYKASVYEISKDNVEGIHQFQELFLKVKERLHALETMFSIQEAYNYWDLDRECDGRLGEAEIDFPSGSKAMYMELAWTDALKEKMIDEKLFDEEIDWDAVEEKGIVPVCIYDSGAGNSFRQSYRVFCRAEEEPNWIMEIPMDDKEERSYLNAACEQFSEERYGVSLKKLKDELFEMSLMKNTYGKTKTMQKTKEEGR